MRVVDRIFSSLSRWGDTPAFIELAPDSSPLHYSAAEFVLLCEYYETVLREAGVQPRIPVALFIANSVDFVALFLALLRIGAVPAAIKLEYRSFELDAIFENLAPRTVICDGEQMAVLEPYLGSRTVLTRSGPGALQLLRRKNGSEPSEGDLTPIPDNVASINYTYRGYGFPVGALVRYSGYETGAEILQAGLQSLRGERALSILPMSHIFTIVSSIIVPLIYGLTSVISRTLHPRHLVNYIAEHRINYITAVPEIYELIARVAGTSADFSSLRALVSGGSLLTPESFTLISDRFGCEILHGYGLTEFAPVSRNIRNASRPGTIGPPGAQLEWRIADDGELLLRSDSIASGYYRLRGISEDAWENGWFRTGDFADFADGHLLFVAEKKRTCKINGNMVDLAEVERAVCSHPAVETCMVRKEGRELLASVVCLNGETEMSDIQKYLGNLMATYKIPKMTKVRK